MDDQIKNGLITAYEMWLQDESGEQEWFKWIFGCFDRMNELCPDEMNEAFERAKTIMDQKRR